MHRQFETAKRQFQHQLYSYAYYSLRVAADAEDVVQEAFIRLWQHWQEIDQLQLGAWLMRVTQNLIVDHVRKHKTRLATTDDEADFEMIALEESDAHDSPHQRTLKRIVEHSIAKLGDPYRTTLILREIQGMSYEEIGEVLGISVDHVKTDLFRGKRKLREIVSQHPLYHHDILSG
ncbi:MAG: RNA polymerase sigma factor [Pseudomonadota bacterium]